MRFGTVRAVHFMRTTPLEQWKEQAVKFDVMIRNAIESILGFPCQILSLRKPVSRLALEVLDFTK